MRRIIPMFVFFALQHTAWADVHHYEVDAKRFAPYVYFHSREAYFPMTIEEFQKHTHLDNGNYVTNEKMQSSTTILPFFHGLDPKTNQAKVYTIIHPRSETEVDFHYWFFFGYNQGKKFCMGINLYLWPINGCVGKNIQFGDHVGDWEHVVVRLRNGAPYAVIGSVHTGDNEIAWSEVGKNGDHPVVYSAKGSHGFWMRPGRMVYQKIRNYRDLVDETDGGVVFPTEDRLQMVVFDERQQPAIVPPFSAMEFQGRWGNLAMGCGLFRVYPRLSGECRLNAGPKWNWQRAIKKASAKQTQVLGPVARAIQTASGRAAEIKMYLTCYSYDPKNPYLGRARLPPWTWGRDEHHNYIELRGQRSEGFLLIKDSPWTFAKLRDVCLRTIPKGHKLFNFTAAKSRFLADELQLLFVDQPPLEASFDKIVVFGDSLSDPGNLKRYIAPTNWLAKPYFLGHFANGRMWAEYMGRFLHRMPVDNWAYGGQLTSDLVFADDDTEKRKGCPWGEVLPVGI